MTTLAIMPSPEMLGGHWWLWLVIAVLAAFALAGS